MTTDSDAVKSMAERWVDRLESGAGLEGAWRLQRIERRSRPTGEYGSDASSPAVFKDLPLRIRRFAKGIPINYIDAAIRYLISKAPYSGIVFNGTRLEEKYVPVRTWWERDEQATVDRGQARENTYTIFQDLIDIDHFDDEDFSAGGTCSEDTHMRYEYDAALVEDVGPGEQGVTRSVQAISRNEDGTFNYAVVTRVAKTRYGGKQVTKCDEFERVETETWKNAYGDPVSGFLSDDGVSPLSPPVPAPCGADPGKTVEVTYRENDDCTYDVTAVTTVELPVSDAVVVRENTLHNKVVTVTHRNGTDTGDSPSYGGQVRTEKTEGGRMNLQVVRTEANPSSSWDAVTNMNRLYEKRVWFINKTEAEYKELFERETAEFSRKLEQWAVQDRPVNTFDVTPSVNRLEASGLFDGQIVLQAKWSMLAAGQTDSVDKTFFWHAAHFSFVDTKKGTNKTRWTYSALGRGIRRLGQLLSGAPGGFDFTYRFDYNAHDSTWTLQRNETVDNSVKPS